MQCGNSYSAAAAAKLLQSCPTLWDSIDGSLPGSPVPGILRQEHWSGLPFPSPMHESESEVAQSCPTLSYPMDCSLPGSSVHGNFQARVLEWGAIAFSIKYQKYHRFRLGMANMLHMLSFPLSLCRKHSYLIMAFSCTNLQNSLHKVL